MSKTLDGIITSWNPGAEKIFGYTAAEAIGQHITLIIPPQYHAEENEVLARIRRGEKVDHFETVRQAKDGRKINISLTVSPIRDSRGRLIGASKVARDITEREQAVRERQELLGREKAAWREVQRANRLLDDQVEALTREVLAREKAQTELAETLDARAEFIAVAAHELRNPLNVLTLTVQLLYRKSGDPAGQSQVRLLIEELRFQIGRLTALVDRLFDVAQIHIDRFKLYQENFDLGGLIRDVSTRFAREHSDVQISVEAELNIAGAWDQIRIDQALTNLLSNAIKF
ncbi:MAG: PAS domain S-box protein, partial [Candidatus Binataceae bacterium]